VVIEADAAALARAVADLHARPAEAREMGRRGAELVASQHSWAARAAEVDAILCEHLWHRRPRRKSSA
jgi:glycosyltransferase involved in cell wall biosynthesis